MSELRRKIDFVSPSPEARATEGDFLASNLEAQWLLKAVNIMEGQIKAGLDIADELNRQIAWYKKSGNSELLITYAMGIVANIGLQYIRSGKIEARDVLEAAPDAILHAALVYTDDNTDFITCLTVIMKKFCTEFSDEENSGDEVLFPTPNEIKRNPKSPMDMLVLRAQAGDSYAMNKVIEKCKPLVWSLIRKGKYHLPDGDVHDLYQEAMAGITRAVSAYELAKGSFYNLAKLAAIRSLITAVKNANRYKHQPLNKASSLDQPLNNQENSITLGETVAHPLAGIFHIVSTQETLKELDYFLIHKLSDMEYRCITLSAEGYSYEEINEITGYSLRSIDNALQRVRHKVETSGICK